MRYRHLIPCIALRLSLLAPLPVVASCAAPDLPGGPTAADAAQVPEEASTGLALAFAQLCLARFPDRDDLAEGGMPPDTRLVLLSDEVAQRFLYTDPGRAWTYRTPYGEYVVTVQDPPYRACAVRKRFAGVPRRPGLFKAAFRTVARAWAVSEGRDGFVEGVPFQRRRPDLRVLGQAMLLPAARGHPAEVFVEFATLFRDGQVEIRFVRRIPDPEARTIRRT